jgi:hypothetical protein
MADLPRGLQPDRRDLLRGMAGSALLAAAPAAGGARARLDPVLADLHRRTFRYFWETSDARTGLVPDNWPNPDFCSIAATGFALTAYCIGVRSRYVTRAAAARRALTTLRTFWNGPQGDARSGTMGHKGFFYHFLHMDSGLRYRTVELSSVDTTLFLLGALTAGAFFDGPSSDEAEIRRLAVALYERVDWTFMARPNGLISMGWHPEPGLPDHDEAGLIHRNWDRYNEGMMVTLLALASPSHPSPPQGWESWMATIGGSWGTSYGETFLGFAPLFGHQYSHCWYDFRGIADSFMRAHGSDYFVNSARATRAQRRYAIANPGGFRDYGAEIWGLTACRGPGYVKVEVAGRPQVFQGYSARGPQTGDGEGIDDGTIAPTAGASSIAFAPEICAPLIHNLRRRYGDEIYGRYGFTDAFNPSFPRDARPTAGSVRPRAGWTADAYLGIDQGPILIMLENHRSGLIWDLFCRSAVTGPIARRGLRIAGFEPVSRAGGWIRQEGRSR